MKIMGDAFGEFARSFRHVAAISATSSFCLLAGSSLLQLSSTPIAPVISTAFFVAAVLPIAALAVRQALHILFDVRDPHEPLREKSIRSVEGTRAKSKRTKVTNPTKLAPAFAEIPLPGDAGPEDSDDDKSERPLGISHTTSLPLDELGRRKEEAGDRIER